MSPIDQFFLDHSYVAVMAVMAVFFNCAESQTRHHQIDDQT